MENIKIRIESKFWNENDKWCVAAYLPMEYNGWFDSCWDQSREKAETQVMRLIKKHIDFVREMKRPAEVREEVFAF